MKLFLKSILALSAAALLFAGCAKEKFADRQAVGGEMTDVTFTAQMENGTTTKAVADGDGAGTKVNRCIMEVYYADSLFTRMYAPVSNKQASFTLQLVSNRTYKVAFWADSVANAASEQGLITDLYYTTNAKGGLQAVALKGTYVGNKDARDAFALCKEYTVAQGGSTFNAVLRRPFAQINVITTDVAIVKKVAELVPDGVDVTLKNVTVKYNVLDSTAVSGQVSDLNYTASVYNWDTTKEECTLSMDYIFAEKEKAVVDIDWKATKSGNTDVSHSFTSVPYQRNYRTNIKGALLTTTGQWNVTVDPIWESSKTGEQDIIYDVVADIAGANTVIANELAAGKTEISVKFTSQPNDAGAPGSTSEGITCNSILTTNLPEDGILNVLIEAQTKDLFIGDYVSQTSTDIQTSGTNAAVVNVNVPANSGIQKLVINAPSKTVYLNGVQVASAGTITDLDAIVSNNTLVIEKGQSIGTLTIRQGGLEIHGTVGTAVVEVAQGENVYVRDCEGLSQAVYTVLEPYIDIDNGYAGVKKGEDNYDIVAGAAPYVAQIGENKYYSIAAAFASVQEGQTIQMLTNAVVGAQYTITNALALTTSGVTFDLNEKTITVTNNFSFIIGADDITVKNGNIYSAYTEEKVSKHISYTLTVAAVGTGVKLSGIKLKDLNFTGGIRFGGATSAQYKGAADGTITNCNIESGDYYDVYATYGSIVNIESGTFFSIHENNEECIVSENEASFVLTGGVFDRNYNNHLSNYLASTHKLIKLSDDPERWQVVVDNSVAKIGDAGYDSVAEAFASVQAGQTVKMVKDAPISSKIGVSKNCTLDMNGKTITASQKPAFEVTNGTFNIIGNGTINNTAPESWSDDYLLHVKSTGKLVIGSEGQNYDLNINYYIASLTETTIWCGKIEKVECFDTGGDSKIYINGGAIKDFDNGGLSFGGTCTIYLNGGIYGKNPTTLSGTYVIKSGYEVVENTDATTKGAYPWALVKATEYYPGTTIPVVTIDGVVWAPVNCGYDATHKAGLLYQ